MPDIPIVLSTITGRYTHVALGLRYLWANLGELRDHAAIREFHLKQAPMEIVERLLALNPRVIGLGAYIWNIGPITQIAQIIKGVRPDITLVIGGPEASHEYEKTPLFAAADYLIRGEGEVAFAALARELLTGCRPTGKVIEGGMPDLSCLTLPYATYTAHDAEKRLVYVEASRGCPFQCEFCLSSLDTRVREFPLAPFLQAIDRLITLGARHIIFVDRTFNLKPGRVREILGCLRERWHEGLRFHFEIVPDKLTEDMLEEIADFPPGALHLEVGVQTFHPEVQAAISRRQDIEKTARTLHFLRTRTGALLHADLIVGLPGEDLPSFAKGFDQLLALAPHEIQVGVLKRLKGTPIARHVPTHQMVFARQAPYEILQTDCLPFEDVQRLKRFARYFDLYHNAGNFPKSLPLLSGTDRSAFAAFLGLAEHVWAATGRTHEIPLAQLARHLYDYLLKRGIEERRAASAIEADFRRLPGREDKLDFLVRT